MLPWPLRANPVPCKCGLCLSLLGGWRWLDFDYSRVTSNGRFDFDMTLSGPMVGLSLNFYRLFDTRAGYFSFGRVCRMPMAAQAVPQ